MNENEITLKNFSVSDAKFALTLMREIGDISEEYYFTAMQEASNFDVYKAIVARHESSKLYIIWKNDEVPIGIVELLMTPRHNRAEASMYILEYARSPSYALQVWRKIKSIAEACKCRKIVMQVASWNDSVINGLRKMEDIKEEAILRDHIKKDGTFYDAHIFSHFFEKESMVN